MTISAKAVRIMGEMSMVNTCLQADEGAEQDEDDMGYMFLLDATATMHLRDALRPRITYERRDVFIDTFTDGELAHFFRFRREHLHEITKLLRVPKVFYYAPERDRNGRLYYGRSCPGEHALLCALARLTSTSRMMDLMSLLCMDEGTISKCFNSFMAWLQAKWGHRVQNLQLFSGRMQRYSDAFREAGVPSPIKIWAAIDGTLRPTCVPQGLNNMQKENYNGHKRKHGLLYQAITTPDGLIAHISHPVPGRRHDLFALRESGVYDQLWDMWQNTAEVDRFHIFGDPAYIPGTGILSNFRGSTPTMTIAQRELYHALNKCRTFVEWGFAQVIQLFPFLNCLNKQKLGLSPITTWYRSSCILFNIHKCCYGGQTNDFFECPPPTLRQYLGYDQLC